MKFHNFLALARENFQKPPFLSQARAKKGRFFTFLLFYKQNALIYARIFFNAAKMYTYNRAVASPWAGGEHEKFFTPKKGLFGIAPLCAPPTPQISEP